MEQKDEASCNVRVIFREKSINDVKSPMAVATKKAIAKSQEAIEKLKKAL